MFLTTSLTSALMWCIRGSDPVGDSGLMSSAVVGSTWIDKLKPGVLR